MTGPADPVTLFGTAEPPPERLMLKAGPLSAMLEEGNLRAIRFGSVEAVRAVNYLARDSSWGTYKPRLSNRRVEQGSECFTVSYDAVCEGIEGGYSYRMTILGDASGRLTMEAVGEALTDFPTNRTGFVVLHPAEAAGGSLTVTHTDGSVVDTTFPELISPDQPHLDIAALTHDPAPALRCTVTMEGDAFEMEDQRNWADASFKTYVRPLSKPRPYTISKGQRDIQRISIGFDGVAPAAAAAGARETALRIVSTDGRMPALALFIDPDDVEEGLPHAERFRGAYQLIALFDPARGHGSEALRRAARLAQAFGAELAVEAVFDMRSPESEAAAVVGALRESGVRLGAFLIAPRREFKTRPSGLLPEGEVPAGMMVSALRDAGIGVPIGVGTPSNFTEFNRNPPDDEADFVYFGVSSIVHAADDCSVSETVGVYSTILKSARALCPGKPIWLGPCTIATRHNPYGSDVVPNPLNLRIPASRVDPRHGALFGGAFMIAVAAKAVEAEVERLILAAPAGPFGLIGQTGRPVPAHAVHQILASAAGSQCYHVELGGSGLHAVAFRRGTQVCVLLANMSEKTNGLAIQGTVRKAQILEPHGFEGIAIQPRLLVEPYRSLLLAIDP